MEFDIKSEGIDDNSISLRKLIERYTRHLPWFILSIIIFLFLAFIKLYYQIPEYNISTTILIKEPEQGKSITDIEAFQDLGLFSSGNSSLENEIQILTSRNLIKKVVKELRLNTRFFIENSPYNLEQYPNFPIFSNLESSSYNIEEVNLSYEIIIKSEKEFEFIYEGDNKLGTKIFDKKFEVDLGYGITNIKLNLNQPFDSDLIGKKIYVSISSVDEVVDEYMRKLKIETSNEANSNVLSLSLNEAIPEKGISFLNNLVEQYNADAINDKDQVARSTTDFLTLRVELLSAELNAIESTAAQFKTNKGMINAEVEANYFLQSSASNDSEIVTARTQLELVDYMVGELNKANNSDPLPSNIGLSDPSLINLISEYNNLLLQRNRILKSSSVKNPIIVNLDSQINVMRINLVNSLNNLKNSAEIKIDALSNRSGRINSKIASAPRYEKEFKNIVREQETKNALYMFLLQKKEESILSNAVKLNKAKIIDSAYSSRTPVSPKKKLIYLASLLFGLIVPVAIIYLKDLLNTKIYEEKSLKGLRLPFLGDIPLVSSKSKYIINENDNSSLAEAFRYLRTNISFMLDSKEFGKTIFVTSTLGGEGKSFSAINLALSFALSGKRTLLLGLDLRKPKLANYMGVQRKPGVTNFIKTPSLTVNDLIVHHSRFSNLDFISSGDIPPNPVELLMSNRVNDIFTECKLNYEYIIVDTSPVGMVTDAIQISNYADLSIYVIRSGMLDKRMLHIPDRLNKEGKLKNMAILLNAKISKPGNYGYGYGYGGHNNLPWYKVLLNKLRF